MSLCSPGSVGHDFASTTSAHGFGRVVESTNLVRKALWILFIVGGFCMATWMISLRFIAYFEFGATSDITIKFHPKLVFPAVTICNFNRYMLNRLSPEDQGYLKPMKNPPIDVDYWGYYPDYQYDSLAYNQYSNGEGKGKGNVHQYYQYGMGSGSPPDSAGLNGDYSFNFPTSGEADSWDSRLLFGYNFISPSQRSLREGGSNSKSASEFFNIFSGSELVNFTLHKGMEWNNKTVKHCLFKGSLCDLEKDFTHIFSSFGNCYTFNVDGKKFQDQPGIGNGLHLTIDIQQRYYSEMPSLGGTEEAGILVEIHPQWEPPEVESKGMAVGPGKHAYVGISREEHIEIAPPWGSCDPEAKLHHFKNYSMTGCIQECKLKQIQEYCGCKLLHHPGNSEVCSPQKVTHCVDGVLVNIKQRFSETCGNCLAPCNSTVFASEISYADIPSYSARDEFVMKHAPKDQTTGILKQSYVQQNIIELDIYYEDLNIYRTIKRPIIDSSALISDIGGQLGLFLGFSALTFMEVFEFFMFKCNKCLSNCRRHRVSVEQTVDKENKGSTE